MIGCSYEIETVEMCGLEIGWRAGLGRGARVPVAGRSFSLYGACANARCNSYDTLFVSFLLAPTAKLDECRPSGEQ